ncbi:MAG: hypothetical protein JW739_05730 [Opitutales bacterium]|nr:hypothetical protein [Opitutales bacterium]
MKELSAPISLYYNVKKVPDIEDIAEAMIAYHRMMRYVPEVLGLIDKNLPYYNLRIEFHRASSGSFGLESLLKVVFGDEEKSQEYLDKLREKFHIIEFMNKNPILGAAIMGGVLLTGIVGYNEFVRGKPIPTTQIEANNNVIIQVGASEMGITKDDLNGYIRTVLESKSAAERRKIVKDSIAIIRPSKKDPNSVIQMNGTDLVLTSDTLATIPETAAEIPEERTVRYNSTDIYIRATDLDNKKSGWAVIVPEVSDGRSRMALSSSIKPSDIFGAKKILGDVEVLFQIDKDGEEKVKKYTLLRIEQQH